MITKENCEFFKIKCKQCKGSKKLGPFKCIYCSNGKIEWCQTCQRNSSECKTNFTRPYINQINKRALILSNLAWLGLESEYQYIACGLFSPLVFKITEKYYKKKSKTLEEKTNINIGFEVYNKQGDLILITNPPISIEVANKLLLSISEKVNGT